MKYFLILALFFMVNVSQVQAVTLPTFPACANPQGSIKADYSDGVHGIVGKTAEYRGKDTVYTLSDSTVTQCFCPSQGSGIQTNWMKTSSLTDDDIKVLKSQGWIYVPTGAVWGLSDTPYLAQNSDFVCNGGVGGENVVGAATVGSVLGLANTGDTVLLIGTGAAGLGFLLLGLYLLYSIKKHRKS